MLMNKQFTAALIIIFTLFHNKLDLEAQVNNSIYTMFGVGQLLDNSFGINKSLGGTGIAFQSGVNINYLNPASYLGIVPNSYILEAGLYGVSNKSENDGTSQSDSKVNLNYFSLSVYFADWWATSFGMIPFSNVDYEINSKDKISGDLISLNKFYKGTGGLNQIYWGNSFRIFDGLSVGFNASYIVGPITQIEKVESSENFIGYEIKNERTANSFYLDYGIQYSYNSEDWLYTIGAIYGGSKKLKTTDDLVFTYNNADTELVQDEILDIKVPQKFGLGFSIKKGRKFKAGFDYEWKNWSSINFSNPNTNTKNSNRYSIGVEYSPIKERKNSWFDTFTYRLGANYKNSYLEIDGTQIDSKAINLGLGIPYDKLSNINLAIEYGEEGTLENGYWMFYINISLHGLWSKAFR